MNKLISYYDLLGLVKDGKAPKKVKWDMFEFEFGKSNYSFFDEYNNVHFLADYLSMLDMFEKIVEIIEKPEQEELAEIALIKSPMFDEDIKINEVIKLQNKIVRKIKEMEGKK